MQRAVPGVRAVARLRAQVVQVVLATAVTIVIRHAGQLARLDAQVVLEDVPMPALIPVRRIAIAHVPAVQAVEMLALENVAVIALEVVATPVKDAAGTVWQLVRRLVVVRAALDARALVRRIA